MEEILKVKVQRTKPKQQNHLEEKLKTIQRGNLWMPLYWWTIPNQSMFTWVLHVFNDFGRSTVTTKVSKRPKTSKNENQPDHEIDDNNDKVKEKQPTKNIRRVGTTPAGSNAKIVTKFEGHEEDVDDVLQDAIDGLIGKEKKSLPETNGKHTTKGKPTFLDELSSSE